MKSNDTSRQIVAYERRMKILRLRLAGASYPRIARELQAEYGASLRDWGPRFVARDLARLFKQIRERSQAEADVRLEQTLVQLDEILSRLWSAFESGDHSVVPQMLRVIELIWKLRGPCPSGGAERDDARPGLKIVVSVSNISSTVSANDE